MFKGRYDAGKKLANLLTRYKNISDAIILALPRGGVPIAYEISKLLNIPFDICCVRKLGLPLRKEVTMGAIALANTILDQKSN
ncbi:MAG: hypothetical protein AB8U25_03875 [Rickettsiales endosymbiont of Dermacentor nuttalli]